MNLAQQRRERLLGEMRQAGIEAIIVFGTNWQEAYLRYVSDFCILEGSGVSVLKSDGSCQIILDSVAEAERAHEEAGGLKVSYARDLSQAIAPVLEPFANQRLAAAPPHLMPAGFLAHGDRLRVEDGVALLDRLMMEKFPAEIDAMRRAAVLADEGYTYFREAARPGRAQYEIVAEVEALLRRRGSPDNFMIIGSGGVDVRGMAPPSQRKLKVGDLVTTELTPSVEGYFSQICRTLVLGEATDTQKRAFNVYHEAMEAGIATVKPGVTASDIARAENDVFRKHGLGEYVTNKYTRVRGHGLGLMCDLKPNILEEIDVEMRPGMTIIVHPNTYHPEVGYVVLGDMLVVTETGHERLTRTPATLFEMPV